MAKSARQVWDLNELLEKAIAATGGA